LNKDGGEPICKILERMIVKKNSERAGFSEIESLFEGIP
jgi:hypothetical protein